MKNFIISIYGLGSTVSRLQSHYQETGFFLPLCPQEFLVRIWSTSEVWKTKLTLELPSGFATGTPGFGI